MPAADSDRLTRLRIGSVKAEKLKWSEGMSFSVPEHISRQLLESAASDGSIQISELSAYSFLNADLNSHRMRNAYCMRKPAQSNMAFSYQRIPSWVRDLTAKLIGRIQYRNKSRWAEYPDWPIDLSFDFIQDLLSADEKISFNDCTPVLLTHDLDTAEGLVNLEKMFLPIEESFGAHSVNYIVAKGWPIDHDLLREVKNRDHEIGVHGYDHSNKTAFLEPEDRAQRIAEFKPLIDAYDMKGYRSPSLLCTPGLLESLGNSFRYDSSIPTSGGLFPLPNYGCASARPFWIGNLFEIPLSLPRDGSMLFLGFKPEQILKTWIRCCEVISASGGVVVLLTHCEKRFSGNPAMLEIYRDFISYIASDSRYKFCTAEELMTDSTQQKIQ